MLLRRKQKQYFNNVNIHIFCLFLCLKFFYINKECVLDYNFMTPLGPDLGEICVMLSIFLTIVSLSPTCMIIVGKCELKLLTDNCKLSGIYPLFL